MDAQAEALAFLAKGAGLETRGHKIARVDTHASAVFLVDERALKLKRAVRFSYLDYSTVALREKACRTEFELNRRIAPALYLGVRRITRDAGGKIALDGEGETLDWIVEMRRFDGESLFDRLAEKRALTPALMRDLADEIAAFHRAAERTEGGGGNAMARVVAGNAENLRASACLDQNAVAQLGATTDAALARVTPLLDARAQQGKVRACHGDLHLGNICLFEGRPTLFDAIEFSPELAHIDVLYDLAFLLMDLVHRGLNGFANQVMNRYLDLGGDDEGLAALPLFLSQRAVIRAHVTATAAQQQEGSAREQRELAARRYLALAQTLLVPAPPRLIAVGGRSGSGKSTVAQAVAPDLPPPPGARVLRSDVMRKAMLGLAPETPLPAEAYRGAMGKQVYARMRHEAARVLATGTSVILDATFLDPDARAEAALIAKNAGVPFTGFWLEAPRALMEARLRERRGDASDATVAVLAGQYEAEPGALDWRRLNSTGPATRVAAALRRAAGIQPLTGRAASPRMVDAAEKDGRAR
ncbi:MAG TPA: AAA family ATPase [Stellaceae bacterium]|nr:AAA family ATPase [Stellaceae bacterium]